ncbi:MAG: hypothetical protein ACK5N9_25130, partial [Pirellula sp.]
MVFQTLLLMVAIGSTHILLVQDNSSPQSEIDFTELDLTMEERAVFCCVLFLEGKRQEFDAQTVVLPGDAKEDLIKQIVYLDTNYHSGRITSFLLSSRPSKDLITWAVECSASCRNYSLSLMYLKLVSGESKSYRDISTRLLTIAASYGEPELVLPLDLDESVVSSILNDDYVSKRATQIKLGAEISKSIGLNRDWAEVIFGYRYDSGDFVPKTEDELSRLISGSDSVDQQFIHRFLFSAYCVQEGDISVARKQFEILKELVNSDDTLMRSRIPEMSFLSSRLGDDSYLRSHLESGRFQSSRFRLKLPALLAAAAERELYEDIFELVELIGKLKHTEVKA